MKSVILAVIISVVALVAVNANAQASDPNYLNVTQYTMVGFAGVRASNNATTTIQTINVPGFATKAKCEQAITDLKALTYLPVNSSGITVVALGLNLEADCVGVAIVTPRLVPLAQ